MKCPACGLKEMRGWENEIEKFSHSPEFAARAGVSSLPQAVVVRTTYFHADGTRCG